MGFVTLKPQYASGSSTSSRLNWSCWQGFPKHPDGCFSVSLFHICRDCSWAGVQAVLQLVQESLGLANLYIGIFCQVRDTQNKLFIIFLVMYSWLYSSVWRWTVHLNVPPMLVMSVAAYIVSLSFTWSFIVFLMFSFLFVLSFPQPSFRTHYPLE